MNKKLYIFKILFFTLAFAGSLHAQVYIENDCPDSCKEVEAGEYYECQLEAHGGSGQYTYLINNGALPQGLNLDESNGVISGRINENASRQNFSFDIKVVDLNINDSYGIFNFTIDVYKKFKITTQTIKESEIINKNYSNDIRVSGGKSPYTFTVSEGSLPPGITLNNDGTCEAQINGVPETTGDYTFTIKVTDNLNISDQVSYCITIVNELTIQTNTLKDGIFSKEYNQPLTAAGGYGKYTWSLYYGNLPSGLKIDSTKSEINGIPILDCNEQDFNEHNNYTYEFGLKVCDQNGHIDYKSFNLRISKEIEIISREFVGIVNQDFSKLLTVSGGIYPYTYEINSGYTNGLTLNPSNGILSGKPQSTGVYILNVTVKDSSKPFCQTANRKVIISINKSFIIKTPPVINPSVSEEEIEPFIIQTDGGVSPYTFSIIDGKIPYGITICDSTGLISGKPMESGNFYFIVQIIDGNMQSAEKMFIWNIKEKLEIETSGLVSGTIGKEYYQKLEGKGGIIPYKWNFDDLTEGLKFDINNELIYGIPLKALNEPLIIQLTDSDKPPNKVKKEFIFDIKDNKLMIESNNICNGKLNRAYSAKLSIINGQFPYKWEIINGSLPPELYIDSYQNVSVISGKPIKAGIFNFTIKVTDSNSPPEYIFNDYSILITDPVTINSNFLQDAVSNLYYNEKIYVTGGKRPYKWSIKGTLPEGLNFDYENGIIYGTPTLINEGVQITVTVADSDIPELQSSDTKILSIFVIKDINIRIITDSLTDAAQYDYYSNTLVSEGGRKPYNWDPIDGIIPDGLNFSQSLNNLLIDGIPEKCGNFTFTVGIDDFKYHSAVKTFNLNVNCKCDYKISGNTSGISDVNVKLLDYTSEYEIDNTISDESGYYTFEKIPCGSYYVIAEKQAYLFKCDYNFPIKNINSNNINFNARFYPDNIIRDIKSKALIITSFEPVSKFDESWDNMQLSTDYVYEILENSGYEKNNILYINDENDVKVDDSSDLKTNLFNKIKDFTNDAGKLVIYMAGYGDDNKMWLNESEFLEGNFIDHLQENLSIILIYNGFNSQSITNNSFNSLKRPPIVITNSAQNRKDQFQNNIENNFTGIFWKLLKIQTDIKKAFEFINDKNSSNYEHHIDANANKITNEDEDLNLVEDIIINGSDIIPPKINKISNSKLINTKSDIIWAEIKKQTNNINSVMASISMSNDVTSSYKEEKLLFNSSNDRFEKDYYFENYGKYEVCIYALDDLGYCSLPECYTINRNKILKAVIIAGTQNGHDRDNLWEAVKFNANFSRIALMNNGFIDKNIKYLAPTIYDDNQNKIPYVDEIASKESIETAITEWANDSDILIIYMVDHGGPDTFYINANEELDSATLGGWLNNVSNNVKDKLIFVYDACYSGNFMNNMGQISGDKNIFITSTSPGEQAIFHINGGLSFSSHFWTYLLRGEMDIYSAFYNTKIQLSSYIGVKQTPRINSNSNNEWNENDDFIIADKFSLGENVFCKNTYNKKIINQSLYGEPSTRLKINKDDIKLENIKKVYSIIVPPEKFYYPVVSSDTILKQELLLIDEKYYEGNFRHFNTKGEYLISYYAENNKNEIFLLKNEIVIQKNDIIADAYEPDNHYILATYLDKPQSHNFSSIGDVDWFAFYGLSNESYSLSITFLGENCKAEIEIYEINESYEINKIPNPSPLINNNEINFDFKCTKDGKYFIKLSNSNDYLKKTDYLIHLLNNQFDVYESDNDINNARLIKQGDYNAQTHFFHDENDQDWIKFYGIFQSYYTIKLDLLAEDSKVNFEIYNQKEELQLQELITRDITNKFRYWNCPEDDIYYMKLTHPDRHFGKDTAYDIKIFVPIAAGEGNLFGMVKDYTTREPLTGVIIKIQGKNPSPSENGIFVSSCESGKVELSALKNNYKPYNTSLQCGTLKVMKMPDIYLIPRPSINELIRIMKQIAKIDIDASIDTTNEYFSISELICILKNLSDM